jgi:hypothetical protein
MCRRISGIGGSAGMEYSTLCGSEVKSFQQKEICAPFWLEVYCSHLKVDKRENLLGSDFRFYSRLCSNINIFKKMIWPVLKDCKIVPGNRGRKKARRKGRRKESVGRDSVRRWEGARDSVRE